MLIKCKVSDCHFCSIVAYAVRWRHPVNDDDEDDTTHGLQLTVNDMLGGDI